MAHRAWLAILVAQPSRQEAPVSFTLYLIGFLVFIAGVAWALVTAGVPSLYVMIAAVILLGLGIVAGVSRTRRRDPS